MRRSYASPSHRVAMLVAASFLAACGTVESTAPAPVVDPGPSTAQLQIDFGFVEAVKDCDGIEGDGDFAFKVTTNVSSGGSSTVFSQSVSLGEGGRTGAIGRKVYSVPATSGQQITVQFEASERDKNIIGQTYNDSRLDNARNSIAHKFNSGTWSSLGPRSIELGSGDCRVRLTYTANAM